MKDNKVTVLTLLFFLLCASLIGGVWFLDKRVRELQAQYDELEQRRVDLTSATEALMEQKKVFTEAFNELDNYHVNVASDDMNFYANVQQAVQDKGVEILSTRQQGVNLCEYAAGLGGRIGAGIFRHLSAEVDDAVVDGRIAIARFGVDVGNHGCSGYDEARQSSLLKSRTAPRSALVASIA